MALRAVSFGPVDRLTALRIARDCFLRQSPEATDIVGELPDSAVAQLVGRGHLGPLDAVADHAKQTLIVRRVPQLRLRQHRTFPALALRPMTTRALPVEHLPAALKI